MAGSRIGPMIGALAVVGMLAVTLLPGQPVIAQNRGNVLAVAMHFYPSTFDPGIGVAGTHYRIFVNTYEGLVDYERGTARIIPALAQSWTVSSDLTTFTLRLRPNVRFHDGSTLDAEAVKLSFDRVKKINQGPGVYLRSMREIQAVDPLTVRIVLTQPSATFLFGLSKVYVHGKPHATDPDDGRAWFAANINGTGPFRMVQAEKDQFMVLSRHSPYWRGWADRHLDGLLIRIIPDAGTQKLMLERGEVDMMNLYSIGPDESPENLARRQGVKLVRSATYRTYIYPFNTQKPNSPLRDKRVRKALALAFDYNAVKDIFYGAADTPNGFLAPGFTGHDPRRPKISRDVAAARRMLAEAGYPNGFDTDGLVYQEEEQGRKLGLLLQASFKDAGVNMRIGFAPPIGVFISQMEKIETAATAGAHLMMAPLTADAGTYLRQVFGGDNAGKPWNHSWYANPEVDRLLNEAERTSDERRRIELWRRAESIIIDDQPVIFVAWATPIVEPVRERVMNYIYHPLDYSGIFQFYHVYLR
ncbi:MAG: ABC transporter substrate-binding protein [Armatimonadota bacterium]